MGFFGFWLVTAAYFTLAPLLVASRIGAERPKEERYFYCVFFAVGGFYAFLHILASTVGLGLWRGVVALMILDVALALCLWRNRGWPFARETNDRSTRGDETLFLPGCAVLVAACLSWVVVSYQSDIVRGIDASHYHVPWAVLFAHGNSLFGVSATQHMYPMGHNLLGAWFFLPVHSTSIIDLMNLVPFITIYFALCFFFRSLTGYSGYKWMPWMFFLIFATPLFLVTISIGSDLNYASAYLCLFVILTSAFMKRAIGAIEILGASIACGLILGAKTTGIVSTSVTVVAFGIALALRRGKTTFYWPSRSYLLLSGLAIFVCGGIWPIRNWYLFGSPIAPMGMSILGVQIFDGEDLGAKRYYRSVLADMQAPDYDVLGDLADHLTRFLGEGYYLLFPLVAVAVVDAIRACRSKDTQWLLAANGRLVVLGIGIITIAVHAYVMVGAPWSSLVLYKGLTLRYLQPSLLVLFALLFSCATTSNLPARVARPLSMMALLLLLVVTAERVHDVPLGHYDVPLGHYWRGAFKPHHFPGAIFVAWAAGVLLCFAVPTSGVWRLLLRGLGIGAGVAVVGLILYEMRDATVRQAEVAASEFTANLAAFQQGKLVGKHERREWQRRERRREWQGKWTWRELGYAIEATARTSGRECFGTRVVLFSRFDRPLALQNAEYSRFVVDVSTERLWSAARKAGFMVHLDCDAIIVAKSKQKTDVANKLGVAPADLRILYQGAAYVLLGNAKP